MPKRNSACPCGSGLKYKKCCLPPSRHVDTDEEAHAREFAALAAEHGVARAVSMMYDRGQARVESPGRQPNHAERRRRRRYHAPETEDWTPKQLDRAQAHMDLRRIKLERTLPTHGLTHFRLEMRSVRTFDPIGRKWESSLRRFKGSRNAWLEYYDEAEEIIARGPNAQLPDRDSRPIPQRVQAMREQHERSGLKPGSKKPQRLGSSRKNRHFDRKGFNDPVTQELVRVIRDATEARIGSDGPAAGLFEVLADYYAVELQRVVPGLGGERGRAALAAYLEGLFAGLIERFHPELTPSAFLGQYEREDASFDALPSFTVYAGLVDMGVDPSQLMSPNLASSPRLDGQYA